MSLLLLRLGGASSVEAPRVKDIYENCGGPISHSLSIAEEGGPCQGREGWV